MKYTRQQRRLLEMAGILRRATPDYLLTEGDDDGGGTDDLFADDGGDDEGGDDTGGDDLGDDEGGDEGGEGDEEADGEEEKEPAPELDAADIKKFGSPIFSELEDSLESIFMDATKSGPVKAEKIPTYPGKVTDEEDEVEKELAAEGYSRREINLVLEGRRLLKEAEDDYSAEVFDMEMYAMKIADLIAYREKKLDLPGAIYNGARQMILNKFGVEAELEFKEHMEAALNPEEKRELGMETTSADDLSGGADIPVAVGGSGDGGGGI